MGKGWREDFDAMARKTVIRQLCGKYALMSIEYRDNADLDTMNLASALAAQDIPETAIPDDIVEYSDITVDNSTGEVLNITDPGTITAEK